METHSDFLFRSNLAELDPRRGSTNRVRSRAPGSVFQNIYAEGYPHPATQKQNEARILNYEQQLTNYRRYSKVIARFRMIERGIRVPQQGDPVVSLKGRVVGQVTSCSADTGGHLVGKPTSRSDTPHQAHRWQCSRQPARGPASHATLSTSATRCNCTIAE